MKLYSMSFGVVIGLFIGGVFVYLWYIHLVSIKLQGIHTYIIIHSTQSI